MHTVSEMPSPGVEPVLRVEPWPTETPLFVLNLIAALALWVITIVTIVGAIYAVVIGLFIFTLHLGFIGHLRGNGVRIGPEQLPEIYEAVERLVRRFGLRKMPEVYIVHGGGILNALATRFVGSDILVLYSDLIEACGDNRAARDMIIAHELGHLHRGHVKWQFVLAPVLLVPFLGSALSRAREYTCDRYGLFGAGEKEGAVLGMTILAAGGMLGRRVNRRAMVSQQLGLNNGWMTLAEWLSTHPPLVKRIAQFDPSLVSDPVNGATGAVRAIGIIGAITAPVVVAGLAAALLLPGWLAKQAKPAAEFESEYQAPPLGVAAPQARKDLQRLAAFIDAERRAGRLIPWDTRDLYRRWNSAHPSGEEPVDPFDGDHYGYDQRGGEFFIWSVGPDLESRTADDFIYDSRAAAVRPASN